MNGMKMELHDGNSLGGALCLAVQRLLKWERTRKSAVMVIKSGLVRRSTQQMASDPARVFRKGIVGGGEKNPNPTYGLESTRVSIHEQLRECIQSVLSAQIRKIGNFANLNITYKITVSSLGIRVEYTEGKKERWKFPDPKGITKPFSL